MNIIEEDCALFSCRSSIVSNMDIKTSPYFIALATIATLLFSFACAKTWRASPKPELTHDYAHCNPLSLEEAQMLFVPGYDQTAILVEQCDRYRRERVAIALQTFEVAWKEKLTYTESIRRTLREMLIVFGSETKKVWAAYDMSGTRVDDAELVGETVTPNMIWIYAGDSRERICETSFIHELIHVSIWAQGFERGDPDHLGGYYQGWTDKHNLLLQEVNETLCVLGI